MILKMLLIFQTESELQAMGNLLKKETGDKRDDKAFPVPSLNASDLPLLPSHTPDHSGSYTWVNDTDFFLFFSFFSFSLIFPCGIGRVRSLTAP